MFWQSGYAGHKAVVSAQHGKERVIAPLLEMGLRCGIQPYGQMAKGSVQLLVAVVCRTGCAHSTPL